MWAHTGLGGLLYIYKKRPTYWEGVKSQRLDLGGTIGNNSKLLNKDISKDPKSKQINTKYFH